MSTQKNLTSAAKYNTLKKTLNTINYSRKNVLSAAIFGKCNRYI